MKTEILCIYMPEGGYDGPTHIENCLSIRVSVDADENGIYVISEEEYEGSFASKSRFRASDQVYEVTTGWGIAVIHPEEINFDDAMVDRYFCGRGKKDAS